MSEPSDIRRLISKLNPEAVFVEDFDEALIGPAERFSRVVAAYDHDRCLALMMNRNHILCEEAIRLFDFNIIGSHIGEHAPIFVTDMRWRNGNHIKDSLAEKINDN